MGVLQLLKCALKYWTMCIVWSFFLEYANWILWSTQWFVIIEIGALYNLKLSCADDNEKWSPGIDGIYIFCSPLVAVMVLISLLLKSIIVVNMILSHQQRPNLSFLCFWNSLHYYAFCYCGYVTAVVDFLVPPQWNATFHWYLPTTHAPLPYPTTTQTYTLMSHYLVSLFVESFPMYTLCFRLEWMFKILFIIKTIPDVILCYL